MSKTSKFLGLMVIILASLLVISSTLLGLTMTNTIPNILFGLFLGWTIAMGFFTAGFLLAFVINCAVDAEMEK